MSTSPVAGRDDKVTEKQEEEEEVVEFSGSEDFLKKQLRQLAQQLNKTTNELVESKQKEAENAANLVQAHGWVEDLASRLAVNTSQYEENAAKVAVDLVQEFTKKDKETKESIAVIKQQADMERQNSDRIARELMNKLESSERAQQHLREQMNYNDRMRDIRNEVNNAPRSTINNFATPGAAAPQQRMPETWGETDQLKQANWEKQGIFGTDFKPALRQGQGAAPGFPAAPPQQRLRFQQPDVNAHQHRSSQSPQEEYREFLNQLKRETYAEGWRACAEALDKGGSSVSNSFLSQSDLDLLNPTAVDHKRGVDFMKEKLTEIQRRDEIDFEGLINSPNVPRKRESLLCRNDHMAAEKKKTMML